MPVDPKPVIDKLPLSLLELHLLSMLDRGAETPYDFLQAGVSLGSSIPAFRRMEDAGWVRAKRSAEIGKRQRHSFTLLAKGRKLVVRAGIGLLKQPAPSDFDAILRVLDIAHGANAESTDLVVFLNSEVRDRLATAKQLTSQKADHANGLHFKTNRTQWNAVRLRSEAKFLANIAKSLATNSQKA